MTKKKTKEQPEQPRALFPSGKGEMVPDNLVCSGALPTELNGKPCPYSDNGRMPLPRPLDESDPLYSRDKGEPGDLCPPCAKQSLAHLGHWQGHGKQTFPEELLPLRLFKCRMWFWLTVPGLYEDDAKTIKK